MYSSLVTKILTRALDWFIQSNATIEQANDYLRKLRQVGVSDRVLNEVIAAFYRAAQAPDGEPE